MARIGEVWRADHASDGMACDGKRRNERKKGRKLGPAEGREEVGGWRWWKHG